MDKYQIIILEKIQKKNRGYTVLFYGDREQISIWGQE